ncbi:MAG: hypothetical protein AMXMBFR56_65620 [Polyangiaceae bacterium]
MKAPVFNQLVANLKRDGALTSTPAVYDLDIPGEVLSGNHRVQAALKAGIEEADCKVILGEWQDGVLGPLSRARKVAIQLSHNSLEGDDDPNILADLYSELELDDKLYSGITDEDLKVDELEIASLSAGATQYEELQLLFVPEDAELVKRLVEKLGKKKNPPTVLVGQLATFDAFFDSIVRVKTSRNVHNSALALRLMAQLAVERLEQLEADEAAAAEQKGVA